MAKRGQGAPYALEIARGGQDMMETVFLHLSKDISEVINMYYSIDWPFVAAALQMAATALKSDISPEGRELLDDVVSKCQTIHFKVKSPVGG